MLLTASNTENPGSATSRTSRTAIDPAPRVGRNSQEQLFAAKLRHPRAAHREALIDRVRLQIATGTYETEAKIDALLPRLAQDLGFLQETSDRPAMNKAARRGSQGGGRSS